MFLAVLPFALVGAALLTGCDQTASFYSCSNPDVGHKDSRGEPDPCHLTPEPPPPPPEPTVLVVNMVPFAQSSETWQDSEPHLSINPQNQAVIAGSAFTKNPTGALGLAPIYVSTNGGRVWSLCNIVPSENGFTGDITVAFGGSGKLFAGVLKGGVPLFLNVFRTDSATSSTPMSLLMSRLTSDQPFLTVSRGLGVPDRLYMGSNDFLGPGGKTATIDRANAAAGIPAWSTFRINSRNNCNQDGPSIRTAIAPDGSVYGVFFRWLAPAPCKTSVPLPADVIVVRDNNG